MNQGKIENPDQLPTPEITGDEVREVYSRQADAIESHPNYISKKDENGPSGMTISQFVGYLRARAADNYTNDTWKGNRKDFEMCWDVLSK